MARRSTASLGCSVGAPCTWQRKPSSAYLSARTMPDFASRSDASTSCVLLPMDETMPIPVTTTRFMFASSSSARHRVPMNYRADESGAIRFRFYIAEQPDLEIERAVDHRAVRGEPAVGDAKHELRAHHALDIDAVDDVLHRRQHLPGKLDLAHAERASLPGRTEPAEKKTE